VSRIPDDDAGPAGRRPGGTLATAFLCVMKSAAPYIGSNLIDGALLLARSLLLEHFTREFYFLRRSIHKT
jgi:hypothetical protein